MLILLLFAYNDVAGRKHNLSDNTGKENKQYTQKIQIPFSHMGFIEPLENSTYAQKTKNGIREWNNGETVIKFFFNVANTPDATDSIFMRLKGEAHEDVNIEMTINGIQKKRLSIKAGTVNLNLKPFVPQGSNYQCISFKGLDGKKHYPDLDSMVITYSKNLILNYNTSNYGAPAVHLNYPAANNNHIEWSLGEIMVKPEACRPDMYYMVSGFDGGYSGIQVSADFNLAQPRGNTFLFSVWSDFDTQHPGLIPDEWQPWTDDLRTGDDMRDEGFGNEGSGVHANWFYKWKPNVIYKILLRQENVGTIHRNGKDYPNCKAYTCWMYVPELGGWNFFARYIRPNDKRESLGVPSSFVENPSGSHSSSKYRGYYRHWVKYRGDQNWTKLTGANFGTTGANSLHPRYDVGIGKETIHDANGYGGEFAYIFSGGFTVNTGKPGAKVNLDYTEMPDINLATLPGLKKFDNLMEGDTPEGVEKLLRKNWTATASSEVTTGPYEKGYALLALDGNSSTFWHTPYMNPIPVYPHWIEADMKGEMNVDGFFIQPRGNDVTKTIRIEIKSENKNTWTSLGNFTIKNNGNEQKFTLPTSKKFRYFKITCIDGYSDTPYTSISEIGVFKNRSIQK